MKGKRKIAEKEEEPRSKKANTVQPVMQYFSPEARENASYPLRFPPTPGKVERYILGLNMQFQGLAEEEIDRKLKEVAAREARVPIRTREDVLREAERLGTPMDGPIPPSSMHAFMNRVVIPHAEEASERMGRAANSCAQLGLREVNRYMNSGPSNGLQLRLQMEKTKAAQSAVAEIMDSHADAPPRGSEDYLRALVSIVERSEMVNEQIIGEGYEVLMGKVCPQASIANRTMVVQMLPTSVTRSYADQFLRAPIPGHPLELPCAAGAMCIGRQSNNATCRGFFPPDIWAEIEEAGDKPPPRTCLMCQIMYVSRYNMAYRANQCTDPLVQLCDYKFEVGTGANEFTPNMMIPDIGQFGVHGPFLSDVATRFTPTKKDVDYAGNKFTLPGWSIANFTLASVASVTDSQSLVTETRPPRLSSTLPETTSSEQRRLTHSSSKSNGNLGRREKSKKLN